MDATAIILAAGEGTRMKSKVHKVLHTICGKAMVDYPVDVVKAQGVANPIVVVGHAADSVREHLGDGVRFAVQDKTTGWGTGHAVMSAGEYLKNIKGLVYILAGDMPLLDAADLEEMRKAMEATDAAGAMLTAIADDPKGYGRVLRDETGAVSAIVEHRDCDAEQLKVKEINASVYCFKAEALLSALPRLKNNNNQNEYYLTDVVGILRGDGLRVEPVIIPMENCMGVNDLVQLAQAEKAMRRRLNEKLMRAGVGIIDPENTYIEATVQVGQDTIIHPGCTLQGNTVIGADCVILPHCRMSNAVIGDDTTVESSVLIDCEVGSHTSVGPHAYLRPKAKVGDHCRIGDFVEIKNSVIGNRTKVSHLTYVGDADLGENINLGCGVVFSNYDGKKKYRSTVGDNAFIGCNVNLVSPVNVGENAYIAAGSTLTGDVPADALAIAREKQVNKDGWVIKRKAEGKL